MIFIIQKTTIDLDAYELVLPAMTTGQLMNKILKESIAVQSKLPYRSC